MDSHFLHEFLHAAESHGIYAEDFADQLSSKYTSMGLLVLAAVSVMRQYVFKPIQCWVPAEWPRPWEEFAENYCWTQNTYRVAMQEATHPEAKDRGELAISYYQWVPILLTAQALLCLAPHQLWLMASRRLSGFDPHAVLRFASEVEHAGHQDTRKRLLTYAAWHLAWGARFRGQPPTVAPEVTDRWKEQLQQRQRGCSEEARQSGSVLFILYMICKVVHAGTALGQVFLLQRYLGFNSPLFGWQCARNLLQGGQWRETGVFPRLTFCDLPLRHVGQWNLRSVQCVLAANMVNEKIFIFLWFWFAFCCCTSLTYTVCWLVQLLPPKDRHQVVRRYLRLLSHADQHECADVEHDGHDVEERESVDQASGRLVRLLRLDGVLLLQMIGDNVDCLCAAQLLGRLLDAKRNATETHQGAEGDWSNGSSESEDSCTQPQALTTLMASSV